MSAVEGVGLSKAYGGRQVLAGVDLQVEQGEVFALLGSNGAGKTTLINILTTLIEPDSGRATVAGADVRDDAAGVRRRISVAGQQAAVDNALTADENLYLVCRLRGMRRAEAQARVAHLVERFGLAQVTGRQARTYSGGMRRRLDLAISLAVPPAVLFLDEPTTGLDARSRRDLWSVIASLRREGTTVLLTTQYLEEADQLADRVAVLHEGSIVATGRSAELKATAGSEVVELRDDAGELIREIPTDGTLAGVRDALDQMARDHPRGAVSVRRPSLDDVFLALTAAPASVDA